MTVSSLPPLLHPPAASTPSVPPPPLVTPAANPTVLVVDDDPNSLRMLCDALEDQGYTVLIATNGETALRRLEHVQPDAILLDGVMPGLSGFETCQRIKALPRSAHIPVLFMTGLADTPDVVRGFESGGVDYVVKPIRIAEVLARLTRHTHNARMARMAHDAVDVAGMGVLIADPSGHIVWQSPTAAQWLARLQTPSPTAPTPPHIPQGWLPLLQAPGSLQWPLTPQQHLHVRTMAAPGAAETMVILNLVETTPHYPGDAGSRLSNAALTPREMEVLSWVAKGKTNRDIADILTLSPRTVNKHLEHVFEKLGVETRAAAAALASREMPD